MDSASSGYLNISISVEKNVTHAQIINMACAEWDIALTMILDIDLFLAERFSSIVM